MSCTYLYRHFDVSGEILYVGITDDIERRTESHTRESCWFFMVERVEYEQYNNRKYALKEESRLIKEIRPPMNVTGNPDGRQASARRRELSKSKEYRYYQKTIAWRKKPTLYEKNKLPKKPAFFASLSKAFHKRWGVTIGVTPEHANVTPRWSVMITALIFQLIFIWLLLYE